MTPNENRCAPRYAPLRWPLHKICDAVPKLLGSQHLRDGAGSLLDSKFSPSFGFIESRYTFVTASRPLPACVDSANIFGRRFAHLAQFAQGFGKLHFCSGGLMALVAPAASRPARWLQLAAFRLLQRVGDDCATVASLSSDSSSFLIDSASAATYNSLSRMSSALWPSRRQACRSTWQLLPMWLPWPASLEVSA